MLKLILFFKSLFSGTLKYSGKLKRNLDRWKYMYESDIRTTQLTPKQEQIIGQSLYLTKLEHVISDLEINDMEIIDLEEISNEFNLDPEYISSAKRSINKKAIKNIINKQYGDGVLTDDEKSYLARFASFLEFNSNAVEKLKNKIGSVIFNSELKERIKDKQLTPLEENELKQLIDDLQLDADTITSLIPQQSAKDLEFAKHLWQLKNGVFTPIASSPLNLLNNEQCYLVFTGRLSETQTVFQGYKQNSDMYSHPNWIFNKIQHYHERSKSYPVYKQVTVKYPGKLVLTNCRIAFLFGQKSFTLPFDQLLSFEAYQNGIRFIVDGSAYIVELGFKNIELFAAGLEGAARNYFNEDNEILKKAIQEINNNESFIKINNTAK